MRKWINLFETTETKDVEYYTEEGCGAFAYAIWIAKGKPSNGLIGAISNPDGSGWNGSGRELTHAFYADPETQKGYDIRGGFPIGELKTDPLFGGHCDFLGTWNPETFKKKFMGMSDSKPLYCNGEMVKQALDIISRNPKLYNVTSQEIDPA